MYKSQEEAVQTAEKELESVKIDDEVSDEVCELCGRQMVITYGPHGKFLACPGFPECKNTKPYLCLLYTSRCVSETDLLQVRPDDRWYLERRDMLKDLLRTARKRVYES